MCLESGQRNHSDTNLNSLNLSSFQCHSESGHLNYYCKVLCKTQVFKKHYRLFPQLKNTSSLIFIAIFMTYKYCKFFKRPICGTKAPERAAFPKSLRKDRFMLNNRNYVLMQHMLLEKDLHSYNAIIVITSNVKPCARVNKSWIPTLKHTIWVL